STQVANKGQGTKPPKGKKQKARVDVGMSLEDLTADVARDLGVPEKTQGVVVSSTAYGGPADRAGILRGDIILEVDRKPVKDVDRVFSIVKNTKNMPAY